MEDFLGSIPGLDPSIDYIDKLRSAGYRCPEAVASAPSSVYLKQACDLLPGDADIIFRSATRTQPAKEFKLQDAGEVSKFKFRTQESFERWLRGSGWSGLKRVGDDYAVNDFDDMQTGALYTPAGCSWTGKVKTIEGQLKHIDAGLEMKAGEKAVKVLADEGHVGVRLSPKKEWVFEDAAETEMRQLDAIAVADGCVLVVEATTVADQAKALQLLTSLQFLRECEDALRGALYAQIVTDNPSDKRNMMRVLRGGFEGMPLSLWQENGSDISDGRASPTRGGTVCKAFVCKAPRLGLRPVQRRPPCSIGRLL